MKTIHLGEDYFFTNTISFKEIKKIASAIFEKYKEVDYLPTRIIIENSSISKYTYLITGSNSVSHNEILIRTVDMKGSTFFRVANIQKIGNELLWDDIINCRGDYEIIDTVIIPTGNERELSEYMINHIIE